MGRGDADAPPRPAPRDAGSGARAALGRSREIAQGGEGMDHNALRERTRKWGWAGPREGSRLRQGKGPGRAGGEGLGQDRRKGPSWATPGLREGAEPGQARAEGRDWAGPGRG